jgi:hypothetical protein
MEQAATTKQTHPTNQLKASKQKEMKTTQRLIGKLVPWLGVYFLLVVWVWEMLLFMGPRLLVDRILGGYMDMDEWTNG